MKPILVKRGSVTVTIYYAPVGDYDAYTVSWYEPGGLTGKPNRKRKKFGSLEAAKDFASDTGTRIANGETSALKLTPAEAAAHLRASKLLEPTGKPIELVAAEYANVFQRTTVPLHEIVEFYLKHQQSPISELSVRAIVDEMLKTKEGEQLSDAWIKDLRIRCGKFAASFSCALSTIRTAEIYEWLSKLKIKQKTRLNYRICVAALYSYAKARGYLPKDWDVMDDVPIPEVKRGDIKIFTPEQLTRLLEHVGEELIPYAAVGAFAGLRGSERERVVWEKFDWDSGYITCDRSVTKTNRRRLVPILPVLRAWLKPYRRQTGRICLHKSPTNAIVRAAKKAGIQWEYNALRHSFISYRLAEVKNEAQVALEAGNSVDECRESYLQLVTPQAAALWFGICPKSVTKNGAFKKHARKDG